MTVKAISKADLDPDAADQDSETSFHRAASSGACDVIGVLHAAGADPNARNAVGLTPLHYAVEAAWRESDHRLEEVTRPSGASPQADERAPFRSRCIDGLKALIDAGSDPNVPVIGHWGPYDDGETPLHYASRRGHAEAVRVLLEARADPNAADAARKTSLHQAIQWNHAEIVRALLEANANPKAEDSHRAISLHYAARRDQSDLIEILIEAEADPDARDNDGATPVHYALQWNCAAAVRALRAAGADPNARDNAGKTPLHHAPGAGARYGRFVRKRKYGRAEAVRALLEAGGADPNARDGDGNTPLHDCADNGNCEAVKALLAAGANAKAADDGRVTPLHYVVRNCTVEVVSALVAAGAHPNAIDDDGQTPLQDRHSRG